MLGLASQSFDALTFELYPLLTVRGADIEDLIDCCHVIGWEGAFLGLDFDEEAVELTRVYVLDGIGVAAGPLAEGGEEGRAYLGGPVKEGGLTSIEALLDAVAGQQQVQHYLLVLLLLVNKAK